MQWELYRLFKGWMPEGPNSFSIHQHLKPLYIHLFD